MQTPKVIIHRLDVPWRRESRVQRRRLVRRGLLTAAGAVAGFAVLIGTLNATDEPDLRPPASAAALVPGN